MKTLSRHIAVLVVAIAAFHLEGANANNDDSAAKKLRLDCRSLLAGKADQVFGAIKIAVDEVAISRLELVQIYLLIRSLKGEQLITALKNQISHLAARSRFSNMAKYLLIEQLIREMNQHLAQDDDRDTELQDLKAKIRALSIDLFDLQQTDSDEVLSVAASRGLYDSELALRARSPFGNLTYKNDFHSAFYVGDRVIQSKREVLIQDRSGTVRRYQAFVETEENKLPRPSIGDDNAFDRKIEFRPLVDDGAPRYTVLSPKSGAIGNLLPIGIQIAMPVIPRLVPNP